MTPRQRSRRPTDQEWRQTTPPEPPDPSYAATPRATRPETQDPAARRLGSTRGDPPTESGGRRHLQSPATRRTPPLLERPARRRKTPPRDASAALAATHRPKVAADDTSRAPRPVVRRHSSSDPPGDARPRPVTGPQRPRRPTDRKWRETTPPEALDQSYAATSRAGPARATDRPTAPGASTRRPGSATTTTPGRRRHPPRHRGRDHLRDHTPPQALRRPRPRPTARAPGETDVLSGRRPAGRARASACRAGWRGGGR